MLLLFQAVSGDVPPPTPAPASAPSEQNAGGGGGGRSGGRGKRPRYWWEEIPTQEERQGEELPIAPPEPAYVTQDISAEEVAQMFTRSLRDTPRVEQDDEEDVELLLLSL